jgi:hypothetical protein
MPIHLCRSLARALRLASQILDRAVLMPRRIADKATQSIFNFKSLTTEILRDLDCSADGDPQ